MTRTRILIWAVALLLVACSSTGNKDTIAKLRNEKIEIKEEKIEGGLEKAMLSYQRFVEENPDSALTAEAIRRLADLKLEKEYGTLNAGTESGEWRHTSPAPALAMHPKAASDAGSRSEEMPERIPVHDESEADFEKRAIQAQPNQIVAAAADKPVQGANDLERAGAREAIALYEKLLNDYPQYERNDQVLYQMSRAYEEMGRNKEAMEIMDRMVRDVPQSRYIDEVQFRRAEYFFVHRRYLDAEDAYASIVKIGVSSSFYELALYKLGWTYYKQELYKEALERFIALMDHKVSVGYDFGQTEDEQERKRTEDTLRIISLSFSNLGGANSVVEYFSQNGKRSYEDKIYGNLGEFYFDKRRYADAAATYNAFASRNPFHEVTPNFHMRVIEIQAAGGFPTLVLDSKKKFATTYGLKAEYWEHFDSTKRLDVLGFLKTNLTDLANHYHACYQDPRQAEDKQANFEEALHWYREFLTSFPKATESPAINYQLADLLLENRSLYEAAVEFEKTAYGYPQHEKSSQAGFIAVSVYREQLDLVAPEEKDTVKRQVVRSSLKFADTFPEHEKAAIVLGAAADDLYGMEEYDQALAAATKLLEIFPDADVGVVRDAWLVIGHSSYELSHYSEAENAYVIVLALLPEGDETRDTLIDNLAASIYKQGEQANVAKDYRTAADHFLRVSSVAPTSTIRPNAEYDAATALIQLQDWEMAASVLEAFRNSFPNNPLQPEVTKKIAYVYKENNQLSLAANEYERIERESQDDDIRRDALLVAADLHEKDGNSIRALEVYRRYLEYFPDPVEPNLETRNKIAEILKAQNDTNAYTEELEKIVEIDASAGLARTPRTRYLGAQAALVLAEDEFDSFVAVQLVKPFEENLQKKRELMKKATQKFNQLVDYEIGETTAAATFYLGEIYAHFSKALMTSERPEGLSPLELEQYDLAIEEQAYPFEEKAIEVHESNLKLISRGVYNEWIEKSLQKLAVSMPARYDKQEETIGIISSLETFIFEIFRPTPVETEVAGTAEPETTESAEIEEAGTVAESESVEPAQEKESVVVDKPETEVPDKSGEPTAATESEIAAPAQVEETDAVTEPEPSESSQVEEAGVAAEPESIEPAQIEEPVDVDKPKAEAPAETGEPAAVTESEIAMPAQVEEAGVVDEPEPSESSQVEEAGVDAEPESIEPAQIEEPVVVDKPEAEAPAETGEPTAETESEIATPAQVEEAGVLDELEASESAQAEEAGVVAEPESIEPAQIEEPVVVDKPEAEAPAEAGEPTAVTEAEIAAPAQVEEPGVVAEPETAASEDNAEPTSVTESESVEPAHVEEPGFVAEPVTATPAENAEPAAVIESESVKSSRVKESVVVENSETETPTETGKPSAVTGSEIKAPAQAEEVGAVAEPLQGGQADLPPTRKDGATRR